jgi:hypothetical protein
MKGASWPLDGTWRLAGARRETGRAMENSGSARFSQSARPNDDPKNADLGFPGDGSPTFAAVGLQAL